MYIYVGAEIFIYLIFLVNFVVLYKSFGMKMQNYLYKFVWIIRKWIFSIKMFYVIYANHFMVTSRL